MSFVQQVEPKAGTPGVSVEAAAPHEGAQPPPSGGGPIMMLLPLLLLVPFLFMSFRRQKKEQEARANLRKGDRVVTQAGLIGELVEIDDRVAKVKIAPGTTAQVLATSLSPFDPAPVDKGAKSDKSDTKPDKSLGDVLKDAKAAADKK
jgi:preprotein translocase subunit YajC